MFVPKKDHGRVFAQRVSLEGRGQRSSKFKEKGVLVHVEPGTLNPEH
jgi:hypothetical protein